MTHLRGRNAPMLSFPWKRRISPFESSFPWEWRLEEHDSLPNTPSYSATVFQIYRPRLWPAIPYLRSRPTKYVRPRTPTNASSSDLTLPPKSRYASGLTLLPQRVILGLDPGIWIEWDSHCHGNDAEGVLPTVSQIYRSRLRSTNALFSGPETFPKWHHHWFRPPLIASSSGLTLAHNASSSGLTRGSKND